jgi:photosystem II stability/assembly factor-like uncharacterized protein
MGRRLFVATGAGLHAFDEGAEGWEAVAVGLKEEAVTSVSASKYAILAGTRNGVFISRDKGESWRGTTRGLTERHVRWLAYHLDDPWLAFAGTEPAAIFYTDDGAKNWTACPEVAELRDANGWYLPYSPEAGCVRGFAFHGSRGYAAVEQGGLLRTDDGGLSWRLVGGTTGDPDAPLLDGQIHIDVHSVAIHPSSPDLVFAPTGGGLYVSDDGGESWTRLYDCYCRAVWLDPDDADHLVFGPADGVDSNGRVEETTDGGETWSDASEGLDVPWPEHMVGRLARVGDELMAVLSNGHLMAAPLGTLVWRRILPDLTGVAAVASLET